ncbi:MAG: Smr/MutS family protein [Candidatus Sumerlaeota bacterium]|nr:Smr/MutS family protein [Candidatus Sumerlaeota bacterium]
MLEIVAGYAASEPGRLAVLDLKPLTAPDAAKAALILVYEWTGLMQRSMDAPMAGIQDISESLTVLSVAGTIVEPEKLHEIGAVAAASENLRAHFSTHQEAAPNLWRLASRLAPAPKTRHAIERAIAPDGSILDNASSELRHIRREKQQMEGRLVAHLQKMVSHLHKDGALAEDFYTQRNGRYVLPVKAGSRGKVAGIVHDASNTGQTIFIEPYSVIEMSNEAMQLQIRETEEIRRILLEICDIVREESSALRANLATLIQLDSIHARARFGHRNDCAIPQLKPNAPLDLRRAHHPLLYMSRRAASIPVSIQLDEGDRALVISGPNAGGKTTALKTLGLLCMMAQCAIPAPADAQSSFPIYSRFYADIGDEQDVEAGVSTFSSHIRSIRDIIENADAHSLVLLDELGTATDPTEGGCLAVAIVERLATQAALVVVTSHMAVLKNWAAGDAHARNCSFHLREDTHEPSFQLTMDVPGASEALIVAQLQGLDEALIERARELLPAGQEDATSLILSLQRKNEDLDAMKREQAGHLDKLEEERDHYQKLFAQYDAERRQFKKTLAEEKKKQLDAARAEIERRIAGVADKEALKQAQAALKREQQQAAKEIESLTKPMAAPEEIAALKVGSPVVIEGVSGVGIIETLDAARGRAKVVIRNLGMEFPLTRLRPATAEEANILLDQQKASSRRGRMVSVDKRPESAIKLELDLHGMYVEEAVRITDQYLSDAAVHDAKYVRIMHGTGTGRLRRGLHDFLKTHPLVKHFRFGLSEEGGAGVTIVELRE